jgi:hypothetical protein
MRLAEKLDWKGLREWEKAFEGSGGGLSSSANM